MSESNHSELKNIFDSNHTIKTYLVYFIFLANPISTRVAFGNSSLTALDVILVGKFPRYNL